MPSTGPSRANWSRSALSAAPAPGYWILTATSRPSFHTARCTWPMLAAAAARSSNISNLARHPVPSCSAINRLTVAGGIGGAAFCSLASASRYGSAYSSGMPAS